MIVTLVLCVDQETAWNVFVPKSEEDSLVLFRVKVDATNNKLAKGFVVDLAKKAGEEQAVDLQVGVYFLSTASSLQYQQAKEIRVQVYGGKDPWPPPPPPAPQGSAVATSALYTIDNLQALGPAGGGDGWVGVCASLASGAGVLKSSLAGQVAAAAQGRPVEAILLSLTKTPGQIDSPRAPELVQKVEDLLRERFSVVQSEVLESAQAKKQAVIAALRAACGRLIEQPTGLLVLAFSGHGGITKTGHSWRLYDEPLTDHDLAAEFAVLPAGVEVVLISDCCYGSGILRPGGKVGGKVVSLSDLGLQELYDKIVAGEWGNDLLWRERVTDMLKLRRFPQMDSFALLVPMLDDLLALQAKLRTSVVRWASASLDSAVASARNTVCLASTNLALSPDGTKKNRFAQCLQDAMKVGAPPRRYDLLDDEMLQCLVSRGEEGQEQASWRVEAEPAAAAALPPFAP